MSYKKFRVKCPRCGKINDGACVRKEFGGLTRSGREPVSHRWVIAMTDTRCSHLLDCHAEDPSMIGFAPKGVEYVTSEDVT